MIQVNELKTDGEIFLYELFKDRTFRDIGYDIKQVLQGCIRTVPYSNKNVVASVGFVCTMAMLMLKTNNSESIAVFREIKECVCSFSIGVISWSDFVRLIWDNQKKLNISNSFHDAIITHIEEMALDAMDYLDAVPGDYNLG